MQERMVLRRQKKRRESEIKRKREMYRQELKKKNKEFRKERAAVKSKKLKEYMIMP